MHILVNCRQVLSGETTMTIRSDMDRIGRLIRDRVRPMSTKTQLAIVRRDRKIGSMRAGVTFWALSGARGHGGSPRPRATQAAVLPQTLVVPTPPLALKKVTNWPEVEAGPRICLARVARAVTLTDNSRRSSGRTRYSSAPAAR